MNSVKSITLNFESLTDNNRTDILLYGDSQFNEKKINFGSNHKLPKKF